METYIENEKNCSVGAILVGFTYNLNYVKEDIKWYSQIYIIPFKIYLGSYVLVFRLIFLWLEKQNISIHDFINW